MSKFGRCSGCGWQQKTKIEKKNNNFEIFTWTLHQNKSHLIKKGGKDLNLIKIEQETSQKWSSHLQATDFSSKFMRILPKNPCFQEAKQKLTQLNTNNARSELARKFETQKSNNLGKKKQKPRHSFRGSRKQKQPLSYPMVFSLCFLKTQTFSDTQTVVL